MWRVDVLTGGSSFLYQTHVCHSDTDADFSCLRLRGARPLPSFSLLLRPGGGSARPVLSVDLCRTIPLLCLAESEFTICRALRAPEGILGDFRNAEANRSRPTLIPLSL